MNCWPSPKKKCALTYIDPDFLNWNFVKDEAGKIYEFDIWSPKHSVTSQNVREHFQARGFQGNTTAFITWLKEQKPNGYHASIPEDNGCWRDSDGSLFVPYSGFGVEFREFDRRWIGLDWHDHWSFVAFRELPLNTGTLDSSESSKALGLSALGHDPAIASHLAEIGKQFKRIADRMEKSEESRKK